MVYKNDVTERAYRARCRPRHDESAFQVVMEQSDLWIVAERDLSALAMDALQAVRSLLKGYISLHPRFAASFVPVEVEQTAPRVIREMAVAAARCGVGPMAAVAGAVAQYVAERLARESATVLVENGGDLFLRSVQERVVGILADPGNDSSLGLVLPPQAFPVALCSSSATIGHSVSLGKGELVVVRSSGGAFADAAATALCNLLHVPKDLDKVVRQAQTWARRDSSYPDDCVLQGVLAQCKGQIAVWGDMELTMV